KMEYAEVVAAVRMAMRGERDFVLSNEDATNLLRPWFQQCRQQGLADVALVFSYQLDAPGLWEPSEHEAVLCWYASGRITKLTIQLADGQFRLTEKPLPVAGLRKPVCKDNLQSFRNALLDTASVATSDWWRQFFMDAVRILDSPRCSYEESKSGFYLPEPYYKYLLAVRHARLGGGMGGWYDQPGSYTRDYRLATHQLEYEKCQALLYAVNNC
ncbi:MAG: hypothetical protein IJ527_09225, partial [Prevotella sp.]|nr:hypothetical protein [Prevotella sp.]